MWFRFVSISLFLRQHGIMTGNVVRKKARNNVISNLLDDLVHIWKQLPKKNHGRKLQYEIPDRFLFWCFVGKWFAKMSHYILFQKGTSAIMAWKTFLKLIHHNYEDSKAIKSLILTPIDFSYNFPAFQSTSHNIQIR